jgi:hypothetical protein
LAFPRTEEEVVDFVLQLRLLLLQVETAVVVAQTPPFHVARFLKNTVASVAAVGRLRFDNFDVGFGCGGVRVGEGVAGGLEVGGLLRRGEVVVVHEADDGTLLGLQRSHPIVLFVIIKSARIDSQAGWAMPTF